VTPHPLDNPVWSSLTTCHASLALRAGRAGRYPADVAPFVGIAPGDGDALADVERLVERAELVCFVGAAPKLGEGWRIEQSVPIAQMLRDAPLDVPAGPPVALVESEREIEALLELTALVYPHYFRPRTVAMGRYLAIHDGARLAAMAGERMHCQGFCEISAVCTHPDYLGRGYARRLIALATNAILDRGERPFLHFSHENTRAKALYTRLGFAFRTDIPLLVTTRL
jgi:ribosomal protein S18 acetylase RimI-like enzyme